MAPDRIVAKGEATVQVLTAVGARERVRASASEPLFGPLGVLEILDRSCSLLIRRLGTFLGLGLVLWFPLRVAQVVAFLPSMHGEGELGFFLGTFLGGLSAYVVQVLTGVVVAEIASREVRGQHVGLWRAFARVLGRPLDLLGYSFLGGLLSFVGALGVGCCGLGFALLWLFSVYPVVFVAERLGPLQALNRSVRLVWGWPSFLRWIGFALPLGLLSVLLTSPTWVFDNPGLHPYLIDTFGGLPPDWAELLLALPLSLGAALSGALGAIAVTIYYFDTRARREGLDLRLRLQRVGGVSSEGRGATP